MKCRSWFALLLVITAFAWCVAAGPRLADARNAGCSLASSPSGYACDPWSTHLYVSRGIAKSGNTLRLTVIHDPDYEGDENDRKVAPGHDYYQQLTVDIPFTTAIRNFVCVAFASAPSGGAVDASSPTFLTDVPNHPGSSLLAGPSFDGTAHVSNIEAICGTSRLAAVVAPHVVTEGKAALPDVALAVPMTPKPQSFVVGARFSAWVARGVLYIDEESEMSQPVTATVVAAQ